jgi:anti-anti-sigma regulatory factor
MECVEELNESPDTNGAYLNVDDTGSAITINVGEDLDLRLRDIFLRAVACAQRNVASRIVVDLSQTRRIFDSGLAMLMLLNDRAWRLSGKIRIINCRPELKQRLARGLAVGKFNLVQGCQD